MLKIIFKCCSYLLKLFILLQLSSSFVCRNAWLFFCLQLYVNIFFLKANTYMQFSPEYNKKKKKNNIKHVHTWTIKHVRILIGQTTPQRAIIYKIVIYLLAHNFSLLNRDNCITIKQVFSFVLIDQRDEKGGRLFFHLAKKKYINTLIVFLIVFCFMFFCFACLLSVSMCVCVFKWCLFLRF